MGNGRVGTSACSVRGFYSRKSRQSHQRLRAIFREIRERAIITQCAFRTLHADVLTSLTTLLRRICYSLFLSIRVCDPKTGNMFFCSSVGKTHRSSLTTHCSQLIAQNSKICRICVICVPFTIFVKKQEKGIWG